MSATDGLYARLYSGATWGLNGFAASVSEWHARELPGKDAMVRIAKPVEEIGEMVGAGIKADEQEKGLRPTATKDYRSESHDEWADAVISLMGAAEALGIINPDAVLARRWYGDVAERRFATADVNQ